MTRHLLKAGVCGLLSVAYYEMARRAYLRWRWSL